MVQFNTKANEILLKLVYYGPGLSGKTTNLHSLHAMSIESQRSEMFSVNTKEDRTLFFDLLPMKLGTIHGNSIHLQIYTVPGQVQYDASRRVVLGGADGVVFVADSRESKLQENLDSLANLSQNLTANRLSLETTPLIFQYNKRDLPDAMPVGLLNQRLNDQGRLFFEGVASQGVGVLDTLVAVARQTVDTTFKKYQLHRKVHDFNDLLEQVEASLRATLHALPPAPEERLMSPEPSTTVLRHDNVSVDDVPSDKPADANALLEEALKSNMETARLYSELKTIKEELENKNQDLARLNTQLYKNNQSNLKTKKFLEGLVQTMGEALIAFSSEARILTWNETAERIFGFQKADVLGKPISMLLPDEAEEELKKIIQRVARGEVLRDQAMIALRRGGVFFPARVTYAPIRNPENQVIAVSALVRDISEITESGAHAIYRAESKNGAPTHDNFGHSLGEMKRVAKLILESSTDPFQADQAAQIVRLADSMAQVWIKSTVFNKERV
jgi:PAS domain S-box-containing protein